MKTLMSILFIAGIFYTGISSAATVNSAGQAMSLCKAEAQAQNDNYVSSKSAQIKRIRTGFRMKLRVVLDDGSARAKCEVGRDGTVNYSQK
jgi:hypothetical protein